MREFLAVGQYNDTVKLLHDDHGLTEPQLQYLAKRVTVQTPITLPNGALAWQFELPKHLGTVRSDLYGPLAGDAPVAESEVWYSNRGSDRKWLDRMIDKPPRQTRTLTAIGIRPETGLIVLFTAYGGPLMPQNPEDPDNMEPERAREVWSLHALSSQ